MACRACIVLVLLLTALPAAFADAPVKIRQGRHGDMGRVVFDYPGIESFRSQRDGNILTIQFIPPQQIGSIALHVPGVESLGGGAGFARLQLVNGATPSIYRLGDRVVVDTTLARPASNLPQAANLPTPPHLKTEAAAIRTALTLPAEAPPAVSAVSLAPAPVLPIAPPASPPETIGFATQPGAAAFRRGNEAIIVFDTSEVPDLTALQSAPLFAGATLLSLQDAQVIRIPLPASDALALTPVSGGWQVGCVPVQPAAPAPPQTAISTVEFPMQSANESLIVSDPLTGGDLLVGTVTQGSDAADFTESGPGYAVLPAWLGVVVAPQADDLGLNASLKGFELVSAAPNGLPLGALPASAIAAATEAASGQTLDLPRGGAAELWWRMIADQRAAAILPPLGRLNAQITLAGDLLALGLGPEAIGVLDTAVLENPAAQDNGQIAEMRAIGDVLSHHSRPADFTAPGLVPSAELAFWRAAGALDRGETGQAIPGLIAGLPLFETYPGTLRDPLTAEIAEALADNGQLLAAAQLAGSDPDNRRLDLARAKILEDRGQRQAALAAYQALARGADDRAAALANARVVELRLAAGQLNDAQAADALDAQLFDWRAPQHERHMRLRVAELRAAAGQWPQAFTALATARALFPGHRGQIDAIRAALFLKMLNGSAFTQLSPIEAVAVLQQNPDLIPTGGGMQVVNLLAERLDALDLPGAAAPMLNRLIQSVPPGTAQAQLGATLAQVDLDAGSPVAALADLSQTDADNLPPDLAARRNMLAAKAQAAGGNAIAAVSTLAQSPAPGLAPVPVDPQTLAAQAQIAEQSGQWPQAEQALATLVGQSVPASGPLDAGQENLLLRLATAASHNNDSATLSSLSSQYGARVGADAAGQMFQTLTAPPLTGDEGLNQALHEIAQLQALPALMNAVAQPPKDTQDPH